MRSHGGAPASSPKTTGRAPTMLEAGYRWLCSYVRTKRNAKGQRLARTRFDKYVLGWLGVFAPRELNGDHVREFRTMLEDHWSLSPHTVTHVLSDLRCFLGWCVASGVIE